MLIDLHSHLLPNIDDGSKSYRASIRMAKEAVDNGIRAALMTALILKKWTIFIQSVK